MATFNATFQTDGDFAIQFEEDEKLFSAVFENVIAKYPEDADMEAEDLRFGKKGYGRDGEVIGTMPENGDVSGEINTANGKVLIPAGIATGGEIVIAEAERDKLISDNIKSGVTVLGVTGKPTVKDVGDTTAIAADVKNGKRIYLADGSAAVGSYVWDWMGDGAELLNDNIYSDSAKLEDTDFATWTASTTALTLAASTDLPAIPINLADYEYLLRWRFDSDFEYALGVTKKAIPLRQAIEVWQAIIKRPSNLTNLLSENFNGNGCITLMTVPVMEYYNTSGSHTMTYTGSYGVYCAAVAATFSNSTSDTPNLTIKTPTVSARCNSSYFATARGAYVDQANSGYHMKGMLYRTPVGGVTRKLYEYAVDLFNNPLT